MAHILTNVAVPPKHEVSKAASLAKELGLVVLAKRFEKPLVEHTFKELSDDEITLWAYHCPTQYLPGGGEASNIKVLENYAFDNIPVEVMQHWISLKDIYAFDHYEIWTTERTVRSDPLLIGVVGIKLYLLARWGLESPDQMPIKQIAQQVHDQLYKKSEQDVNNYHSYPFQSQRSKRKALARALSYYKESVRIFAAAERILELSR